MGIDLSTISNLNLNLWPAVNKGMLLLFLLVAIAVIFSVIGLGLYFYKNKIGKYKQFRCIIWQKDNLSGNIIEKVDDGGIFIDKKTEVYGLWLRRQPGVVLNADQIPWIQSGKTKVIYLLQCGIKSFKYVQPSVTTEGLKFNLGEEDINWGIFEYRNSHNLLKKDEFGKQVVAQVFFFVIAILIVIMIYFLLQKLDILIPVLNTIKEIAMIQNNIR